MSSSIIKQRGENFKVSRTNEKIIGAQARRGTQKVLLFYSDSNISPEDTITRLGTGEIFHVTDIEFNPISPIDQVQTKTIKYQTEQEYKKSKEAPQTNTFNIDNVNNSVIGNNNTVSYTIGITDIEELIRKNSPDPHEFDELIQALKEIENSKVVEKGKLSKFIDDFAKHAWIASPVAQFLLQKFFM